MSFLRFQRITSEMEIVLDTSIPKSIQITLIRHVLQTKRNTLIVVCFFYPLANEVTKGYSNATVRPSVTSL